MFLPENFQQKKDEETERKKAFRDIEDWAMTLIPEDIREDAVISIQEVECGDPNCSPIDTSVILNFSSDGQGMFGMPMPAKEVTLEELKHFFPTSDVLKKWHKGEEADWPPIDDEDDPFDLLPKLRFPLGTSVLCRVGPEDWTPGIITQLWYREPSWPPESMAPYKIRLEDGSEIFAPGDMDQIIKLNTFDTDTSTRSHEEDILLHKGV